MEVTAAMRDFFQVGDLVLTGKYKNGHGKIVGFSADGKGNPTVEIEPIPKGRKKNRVMGLFKIWHDPPPALRPGGIVTAEDLSEDDEDDDE